MLAFWLLVGATLGGVGFRLRGSAWVAEFLGKDRATTEGRLIWTAAIVALFVFAAFLSGMPDLRPPLHAVMVDLGFGTPARMLFGTLLLFALIFAASTPGWPDCIDLGANGGSFWWKFTKTSARGLLFSLPFAVTEMSLFGPISGAAAGVAYYVGWKSTDWVGVRTIRVGRHYVVWQATEIGEILTGAVIGMAVVLAV